MKIVKLFGILGEGKIFIVDDKDFKYVDGFKWYLNPKGYVKRTSFKKKNGKYKYSCIYLHRILNKTPVGLTTDHIDGNKLDNRRSNLRTCTIQDNLRNKSIQKNNKTGFKGVFYRKDKKVYVANISINDRNLQLGSFKDAIGAAKCYNKAAKKLYGKFYRNIPLTSN